MTMENLPGWAFPALFLAAIAGYAIVMHYLDDATRKTAKEDVPIKTLQVLHRIEWLVAMGVAAVILQALYTVSS